MALAVSSVMALPQTGHREQLPINPGPATAEPSAPAPGDHHLRPLDAAVCSMCGVARPLGLLVPDGNPAGPDVRWYCKDVKSCTERWTTAPPR